METEPRSSGRGSLLGGRDYDEYDREEGGREFHRTYGRTIVQRPELLASRFGNATSAIGAVKAGATSAATAAERAVLPARIGGRDATEAALALAARNGASGASHGAEIATGVPARIGSAAGKAMAAANPDPNGVLSED